MSDFLLDIQIEASESNIETGIWLDELDNQIQEELELKTIKEKEGAPANTMDGGVTIGIAIAGLILSSLSTLLSVLDFQMKKSKNTTITIVGENYTRTISNLSQDEASQLLKEIEDKNLRNIQINVD